MIRNESKQTVFWDVDDVILNSSQTFIECLGENALNKDFSYVKDFNYKSINRKISKEKIGEIFESDIFWSKETVNKDFLDILNNNIFSSYNHKLVTKGSQIGLDKKKNFLKRNLPKLLNDINEENYIPIELHKNKNIVDMSNGIQIDDMFENLEKTNARVKILIKNEIDTEYNTDFKGKFTNMENLYIVNNLRQVKEILEFNLIEKI